MFVKSKRVKSQKTINGVRKGFCEICGRVGNQVHHVISKGAGGPDIEENLINLCAECHIRVHDGSIGREIVWGYVAIRVRKTVEQVRAVVANAMGRGWI